MAISITYSFSPNTTIRSADVNQNFTDCVSWSTTHEADTTTHGATGAVVGTTNSQTLSNKTLASPVITGNLDLHSGADIRAYSDAGSTLKFLVDSATGSFGIPATQKFFLDGTALSGNTYLHEVSADRLQSVVGGSVGFDITNSSSLFTVGSSFNLALSATKKIYFSADYDTCVYEASNLVLGISFDGGSNDMVQVSNSGTFLIQRTGALTLDLRADTDNTSQEDCKIKMQTDGGSATSEVGIQSNGASLVLTSGVANSLYMATTTADAVQLGTDSKARLSISATGGISLLNTAQTTETIFDVANADSLTTGKIINLVSNSTDSSARELVHIENNNTSATSTECLKIIQNATDYAVHIDQNSATVAMYIDLDCNVGTNVYALKIDCDNAGAGLPGGISFSSFSTGEPLFLFPPDTGAIGSYYGRVTVNINGVGTYCIPVYALA